VTLVALEPTDGSEILSDLPDLIESDALVVFSV